jgi:tripartite-type tricarboxylate transporter receptor subunit TctC
MKEGTSMERIRAPALLVATALGAACLPSHAQDAANFPNKPIRFVVGYAPGGATDMIARTIGDKLHEYWGQPVVLDHRPGAGTNIAIELIAKSPKDGYTMMLMTTANAINPTLYPRLRYDAAKDFAMVTNLMTVPGIVVANNALPTKSIPALIDYAKANPDKLRYSSPGFGSTHHLVAELFKSRAGIQIQHVPYKGAGPAMMDTVAGHVDLYFGALVSTLQHVQSKTLHPLAVTSLQRVAVAPQIPTMDEQGLKGFETGAWYGVMVASGTPPEIVDKLNAGIVRALRDPAVAKRFENEGASIVGDSPAAFTKFFAAELTKWGAAVKTSGATVE